MNYSTPGLEVFQKIHGPFKELINLALTDPQELQETAHAKSYIPYFRYYKTVLYLFLRLFGASFIQVDFIFEWILYSTSRYLNVGVGLIWPEVFIVAGI